MTIKASRPGGAGGEHPHRAAYDGAVAKNRLLLDKFGSAVKWDPNHHAYNEYDHGVDSPYDDTEDNG